MWASRCILIIGGGCFPFDQVFSGTDHCCLWIDITFTNMFGHNIPAFVRPKVRRLNCRDPRLIANFNRRLESLLTRHDLLPRYHDLWNEMPYPASLSSIAVYNYLDSIRHSCVKGAEWKCQRLHMGQLACSPSIQLARITNYAWNLLLDDASGRHVSSKLLSRTLKKALLSPMAYGLSVRTVS
jgi:hypothetical protein